MKKVLMLGTDYLTEDWLKTFAETVDITTEFRYLDDYDLLVIPGGLTDILPSLYGESAHKKTYYTEASAKQDALIDQMVKYAKDKKVPTLGICKGAQAVCVANGGKLRQHIEHRDNHDVEFLDRSPPFFTRGNHHQCMDPEGGEILAISAQEETPELVRWGNQIAVQWHPEWMGANTKGRTYIEEMLNEL